MIICVRGSDIVDGRALLTANKPATIDSQLPTQRRISENKKKDLEVTFSSGDGKLDWNVSFVANDNISRTLRATGNVTQLRICIKHGDSTAEIR